MTRPSPDAFIGRERELAALADALTGGARLVTVVGSPGMGKTRLARRFLELPRAQESPFDHAAFCEVSWAASEEDVLSALLRALGLHDVEGDTSFALEALATRAEGLGRTLLVVDNFEPVVQVAASLVGRLLARTRRLSVLVTSRVRLRLEGELVVEMEPLALPAPSASAEEVTRSEAVRFLAAKAQLDVEANGPALAAIARELEGLPLAMELAAARLDVLSARQLLARLSSPLDVLTRSRRDADPRQASLRSALEASWSLLTDEEQAALAALSAFHGGFVLEAAEAVVGAAALDALQGLVEASLVVRRLEAGGARFFLYESVRAFAEEKLRAQGADAETHARHARFFLGLADEAHAAWQRARTPATRALLHRLADEEANLTAAYKRHSGADALRAAVGLAVLAQVRGGALARLPLVRAALDVEGDVPADLRGWATFWRALLERNVGRGHDVMRCLEQTAAHLEEAADPALTCAFLHLRALCAIDGLDASAAVDPAADLGEVVELGGRHGLRTAHAHNLLAAARLIAGDVAGARAAADETLRRARAEEDPVELVAAFATEAALLAHEGDLAGAARVLSEARSAATGELPPRVLANLLRLGAEHLHVAGEGAAAQRAAEELLELARDAGFLRYEGNALHCLALLHLERGHATRARELAARSLELFEAAAPRWQARPLATLAAAMAAEGALDDASAALDRLQAVRRRELPDEEAHVGLATALVDAARARRLLASGGGDAGPPLRRAQEALLAPRRPGAAALRRMLERDLAALDTAPPSADAWPDDALVFEQEGAFFRPPGEARIDTARRPVLRQVLRALVERHMASPGEALDVPALFEAAWPGEKARPDAARARVRVAISTLRKEGMRGVIVTKGSAYALREGLRVLVVAAGPTTQDDAASPDKSRR